MEITEVMRSWIRSWEIIDRGDEEIMSDRTEI